MEIDKYIRELLYDYDCVIVPQLGGFVTNYRPASVSTESGIANPPGKDIRFNKNLTQSDGLLERAVADGTRITFEEASASLKTIAEDYWSKLNGGEKISFKRIGVLYIDEHKKLRFEPARSENYLKASFGLDAFSLPPAIKTFAPVEEPIERETNPEIIAISDYDNAGFKRSKSMYWVAAAALAPFVAMSLYIGLSTNFKSPTELTLAELIPFKKSAFEPASYHIRESTIGNMAIKSELESENFPEKTTVFPYSFEENRIDSSGIWINLDKKSENITLANRATDGPYHIIAGCFSEKANADKYVGRLINRGYKASILDFHKKLHRVEIENFSNYNLALAKLQELRGDGTFPNAWLLKKPKS